MQYLLTTAPSVASLCGSSCLRVLSGAFQRKCLMWSVPKSFVSNASPQPAECGGLLEALCGVRFLRNLKGSGKLALAAWFSFRRREELLGAVLEIQDH